MIETVVLDAGGVIVYPRMGNWLTPVRFEEIIGEKRLACVTGDQVRAAMEQSAKTYLDESLLLEDESWEFAVRRNYFLDLAKRLSWTLTDREADSLARDMTENDARYDLYDDTRQGLTLLSEKYPLCLLSDAMPSLRRILENAGLMELFDAAVLSCEVGATKPNPRMYAAAMAKLDADPATAIFVDDRLDNLEGAEACGIRSIHMCRYGQSPWRGVAVPNLIELAKIL